VLQAPPGKLPRVLEGQIYEFETALESTASSGVSTPVIDSKGLIGSDVAFELMGTGVVFASQESPELFVRALKSQTFSCGPTGTTPFRVRCRFDVSGQAVIELELQVENSSITRSIRLRPMKRGRFWRRCGANDWKPCIPLRLQWA
jgi:hypothetical protein